MSTTQTTAAAGLQLWFSSGIRDQNELGMG